MNLDRALAILGLIIGLLGSAVGIYVSQSNASLGLLLASGWIAAALIATTICSLAFRAVSAMEKSYAIGITALVEARKDADSRADKSNDEVRALANEVAEYKNISRALSAVLNGDDTRAKSSRQRVKRPSPMAAPPSIDTQTVIGESIRSVKDNKNG